MGMTENEFVAKFVAHIGEIKLLALFADFGIEEHMEENIAQFLANLFVVTLHQGIAKFVHLFNGVGAQTFIRLLFIPRAFFTQLFEHVEYTIERFEFFLSTVHFESKFRAKAQRCDVYAVR